MINLHVLLLINALMNWADATEYVRKHQPQAVSWIPFFRDGHVLSNVTFVTYNGQTTKIETHALDIRGIPVSLQRFHGLDDDRKCRQFSKQLRQLNAMLRFSKRKVLELSKEQPYVTFSYETSNGYWSSLISKLHAYTVFAKTGRDILEGRPKRKRKRDDASVRMVANSFANIGDEFVDEEDEDEFFDEVNVDEEVFTDNEASDNEEHYNPNAAFVTTRDSAVSATEPPSATMQKGEDGIYTLSEAPASRRAVTSKYFKIKKYVPPIPPESVRYARHPLTSVKLQRYLIDHPLGDLYENPYRKVAGAHTSKGTKTKAQNCIKDVMRQWALTTADGLAYLEECDIKPSELSIDRIVPENAEVCHGLNFLPNLYFMPIGDNSYFNNKTFGDIGEYKRQYVGAKAWKLATAMNKKFAEDMGSRWLLCNFETQMHAILRGDL